MKFSVLTVINILSKKFLFLCIFGTHFFRFEEFIRNVDNFVSFIDAGPVNSSVVTTINFYIRELNFLLCQPSLASHAALTSTTGISFVWKGKLVI